MKNNDDHSEYHRELRKNIRHYWPALWSPQRWWFEFSMFRDLYLAKKNHRSHDIPTATVSTKNPRADYSEQQFTQCQKMVSQLFDEVQNDALAALKGGWSSSRSPGNFIETPWAFFEFAHEDWGFLYSVRLESQPGLGLVVLGVWHDHESGITRNKQIAKDLKCAGWGGKEGGPWWEGHSPLPKPFTNWTSESGIAALTGRRAELKALLIEEIVKLCSQFKNSLTKLANAAALL
jgi:hypothetical protein